MNVFLDHVTRKRIMKEEKIIFRNGKGHRQYVSCTQIEATDDQRGQTAKGMWRHGKQEEHQTNITKKSSLIKTRNKIMIKITPELIA